MLQVLLKMNLRVAEQLVYSAGIYRRFETASARATQRVRR